MSNRNDCIPRNLLKRTRRKEFKKGLQFEVNKVNAQWRVINGRKGILLNNLSSNQSSCDQGSDKQKSIPRERENQEILFQVVCKKKLGKAKKSNRSICDFRKSKQRKNILQNKNSD